MIKKGYIVKYCAYGYVGMVVEVYRNWQDLKNKNDFHMIDPNPEETSPEERLINDPKDEWLKMQERPISDEELKERWFTVRCLDGGSIWVNEKRLEIVDTLLN